MTRPLNDRLEILRLRDAGFNAFRIARTTGIPRSTVRYWLRIVAAGQPAPRRPGCFRCDERESLQGPEYVYLLGLYLGDGHLAPMARDVWCLRIFQDNRYPALIRRCSETMYSVSHRRISCIAKIGCKAVTGYWKHWIHLFPQHGAGVKSKRPITLEEWQHGAIALHPREFLAGLIHSDGSRSINTIVKITRGVRTAYVYPRYFFANNSIDIRRLFTETCDLLGVHWTQTNVRNIAISRRADVAFLDTFIGPKT